jgi:hypothetical protein
MEYLATLANLLGAERYAQHAICLTNDPVIMTVFVAAHLSINIAYFTIGAALLSKRQILARLSPDAIALYGAFIVACGLTHHMAVWTLFTGIYRLEVAVLAATAGISVVTAVFTAMELWGQET